MQTTTILRAAAAAAVLFAAALPAQTTTYFPTEYQSVAGETIESRFPFGYGISRTQIVLDRAGLAIPAGRQITALKFRQPAGYASTGRSLQLAVFLGGTTLTSQTATGDYLGNYTGGTPRTQVFGPAIFQLPTLSASQPSAEVTVPLTTPYTYAGNENLVVEFVITANNNANQNFTYYLQAPTFRSDVTSFGAGCPTSANTVPVLSASGTYYGGNVGFSLSQAPANSTLYFHLNVAPSTPILGDAFGAPGCSMLVLPLAAVLGTAPGGSFSYNVPVPNNANFYGLELYGQAMIFDLFANTLGFTSSNGCKVTIGRQPPATKILTGGSATATTGSVQRNASPIVGFVHN